MMKKQMKRTVYEAPVTERFQVELEGGFMAGSVIDENKPSTVNAGEQLVNTKDGWGEYTNMFEGWGERE